MPSAYTQNFYHTVFSTKHRAPLITPELEQRLYPFIGGILRDLRCTLLAINGMPDHVHLLIRYRADLRIPKCCNKSKRVPRNGFTKHFRICNNLHGKKASADSP